MDFLNFGFTWSRTHKDGSVLKSAIDHAITNKPAFINKHYQNEIDYSDHNMICVRLNFKVPKLQENITTFRDYRKLRSNPNFFLNELAKIKWESLLAMKDVDEMEMFCSAEIDKCLNFVAPWKSRKYKQNNYCTKLIKTAVREKSGINITRGSSVNDIRKSINDILNPIKSAKNSIKIQTDDHLIKDLLDIAKQFNTFFIEKVKKLADGIKQDSKSDPFSLLTENLQGSNLKFNVRTVSEKVVMKILKSLKGKKSHGCDVINSEIFKLGNDVLVIPLTYIINFSISTGKFPSN